MTRARSERPLVRPENTRKYSETTHLLNIFHFPKFFDYATRLVKYPYRPRGLAQLFGSATHSFGFLIDQCHNFNFFDLNKFWIVEIISQISRKCRTNVLYYFVLKRLLSRCNFNYFQRISHLSLMLLYFHRFRNNFLGFG